MSCNGILNSSKPKRKSYLRQIWSYDQGDYNLLRQKASFTDWDTLYDPDVNIHAQHITNHIMSLTNECIPNRMTRIRQREPQWLTASIKLYIRKRKRTYRKAKRTNLPNDWKNFEILRNKVINMIRESKQNCNEIIVNNFKFNTISSRDWWTTLKTVIAPNTSTSIPPLQNNDSVSHDDLDKANILNDFFRDQTIIDESNAVLPQVDPYTINSNMYSLHFSPVEIESVLKSQKTGKATGPDGMNNRILRELSKEFAVPFCSLSNQSVETGIFPQCWKVAHVCPIYKNGDRSLPSNYCFSLVYSSKSYGKSRL